MAAKEENSSKQEKDDKANIQSKDDEKKEINEMDEKEFDDEQIDPYHGNQPELPEPEPMDLPDELQFDDEEAEQNEQEENPFDIDKQKGLLLFICFTIKIFMVLQRISKRLMMKLINQMK